MTQSKTAIVLVTGVAAMDFVFFVDEMPRRAEKYKTAHAAIQGGGGGGNAASAIARLGGESRFVGRIGSDPVGVMIAGTLEADGVDCRYLRRFPEARSSFASIYVDKHGERQIMSYRDAAMPATTDWLAEPLTCEYNAVLADTRWPAGAAFLLQAAERQGLPGIIDIEAPVKDATDAMLVASHAAFSSQGLRDWAGHDDLERGIDEFARLSGRFACVTNGAFGTYWRKGEKQGHVPSFAITPVDTLGAGDVWHGAFALMLGEGRNETEAIRFANAAAALKCSRPGGRAACPDRAEVMSLLAGTGVSMARSSGNI